MDFKKVTAVALAGVLSAGILVGCSDSATPSAGTDTESVATERPAATAEREEAEATPAEDTESASESGATTERTTNAAQTDDEEGVSAKADDMTPTEEPERMTAEEAAADTVSIEADLNSIRELIDEELYDDALMTINSLLTKDLSDEQRSQVEALKEEVEGLM
ncbi:MAG TPA: hypothetical protein H9685_03485 [Firmicutes bacterium]|nr:hypothetical protein [Bacillota bacterium]